MSSPCRAFSVQPPLCLSSELTVFEVAKRMSDVRTDAAILLNGRGHLEGIVTDNDIARLAENFRLTVATFSCLQSASAKFLASRLVYFFTYHACICSDVCAPKSR